MQIETAKIYYKLQLQLNMLQVGFDKNYKPAC